MEQYYYRIIAEKIKSNLRDIYTAVSCIADITQLS